MNCTHDSVTADICEGDWPDHAVQWCQNCGSYRIGYYLDSSGRPHRFNEWREPSNDLHDKIKQLERRILDDNRSYGFELQDPYGTIWEQAQMLHDENVKLRNQLARSSS